MKNVGQKFQNRDSVNLQVGFTFSRVECNLGPRNFADIALSQGNSRANSQAKNVSFVMYCNFV